MNAPQEQQVWRDYLPTVRWFQGKGLPIDELTIEPLAWYTAEADVWVRSELALVKQGDDTQTYHLLVGYVPAGQGEPDAVVGRTTLPGRGPVDMIDAPRSPQAMRALLGAIGRPGVPGVSWLERPPSPDSAAEAFRGEQTNTTVRIGDEALLKVFRRLIPGPNLESAMLSALRSSGITPRLIGTLSTPDGVFDLGLFSQLIPQARDGWGFCVRACRTGRSVESEMRDLGVTLRRLHAALAAAFGTQVIDAAELSAQMIGRLDAACRQLPELKARRPALRGILGLPSQPIEIQRVHGDFHLGQALVSPTGWAIIDFEGEPLKTPAERAAPDSVWRDVAGLLRSLDYARHSHAEPDGDKAQRWYDSAKNAFLDGYLQGAPLPQRLLTAYDVDKSIYELVYETRNRPGWADIPRRAIEQAIADV